MSDGHLGSINTTEHLIGLNLKERRSVHSSPLGTYQTMSNFATKKVRKMLEEEPIKQANTK